MGCAIKFDVLITNIVVMGLLGSIYCTYSYAALKFREWLNK